VSENKLRQFNSLRFASLRQVLPDDVAEGLRRLYAAVIARGGAGARVNQKMNRYEFEEAQVT
jgi:hypothetical protein